MTNVSVSCIPLANGRMLIDVGGRHGKLHLVLSIADASLVANAIHGACHDLNAVQLAFVTDLHIEPTRHPGPPK